MQLSQRRTFLLALIHMCTMRILCHVQSCAANEAWYYQKCVHAVVTLGPWNMVLELTNTQKLYE